MLILKRGSKGADVERLQILLNTMIRPSPRLDVDGDFGGKTHRAVIQFQSRNSLEQTGIVDVQTWTALGQKASPVVMPAAPAAKPCGDWMTIAEAELGVQREVLPGVHNNRIIEYHSTTTYKATTDETAWCSSFVNWVLIQAGYRGTNSAAAKSWLNWGIPLDTPQVGAITILFSEAIKNKKAAPGQPAKSNSGFHVGFWVSSTPTIIELLGGNQSDRVKRSRFSLTGWEIKGYRWPG